MSVFFTLIKYKNYKFKYFSPAQIVKIAIALAVYCTFGLQFFVCLEIVWNPLKDKCEKRPLICNYVLRTVLVTAAVVLAILVPTIAPFMGLIGAFCFSILGLIMPVSAFKYFIFRVCQIIFYSTKIFYDYKFEIKYIFLIIEI